MPGFVLRHILRPLGRLLRTDRWEPYFCARARCLGCGREHVSVIACSTPLYDPASDALYGMQCPDCGAMACTTLGISDGLMASARPIDPMP